MTIEYTDRYGGNPPSWLTACHGECEATGYVPIFMDERLFIQDAETYAANETDPDYVARWRSAEIETPSDDGWHFVHCKACDGTGRVSWWRAVARLPRWVYKGLRFTLYANKHCPGPSGMSRWQNTVLAFKCAFLADLGLWKP